MYEPEQVNVRSDGREYGIRELSELAGVSARTLRYYDEIGLLKPSYVNEAGYRFYGRAEVNLLQQILFYRERGFGLKKIQRILYQEHFDTLHALEEHLLELEEQKVHMEALIRTVQQTILSMKGEYEMSDKEKFEAFKERVIRENEERFGPEAREKYGDGEVDAVNRRLMNLTEEEWERFQNLGAEIRQRLKEGVLAGIRPDSEEARRIVLLHKEWLGMTWKKYTEEAHRAIVNMYIADERFRDYYDREVEGCASLLEQSVRRWVCSSYGNGQ